MSDAANRIEPAALISYVEEMISTALRNGEVDPVQGLECFLYATNGDFVEAMRLLWRLPADARKRLILEAREALSARVH